MAGQKSEQQAAERTQQQAPQRPTAEQQQAGQAPTGTETASGSIVAASADQVVVAPDSGPQLRVDIAEDTQTALDGKSVSPAQLQPRARADISYHRVGNRLVATRIDGRSTM